MIKALLILALAALSLFADGITGDGSGKAAFDIYVYGDTEFYRQAFNAVAMMVGSGEIDSLMTVGAMISVVLAGWSLLREQSVEEAIKRYGFLMLVLGGALYSKSTVYIVDMRANYNSDIYPQSVTAPFSGHNIGSFAVVENVPWALGAFAWATNHIGSGLTGLVEATVTPVGDEDAKYLSYSSMGFNKQHTTLLAILEQTYLQNAGSEYVNAFSRYTEKCVIADYMTQNRAAALDQIKSLGNLIDNIKYSKFDSDGLEIVGDAGETCKDYYDFISDPEKMAAASEKIQAKIGGSEANITALGRAYVAKTLFTADPSNPATVSDSILNLGVSKYMSKAVANAKETSGGLANTRELTSDMSMQSLQQVGVSIGFFIGKALPYVLDILRAILYVAFPLMAASSVVFGFKNGTMIFSSYFSGLLSLELLNPSLALTQGLSNYFLGSQLSKIYEKTNTNTFAFDSLSSYNFEVASQAGIAGLIGVTAAFTVPALILYGNAKGVAALASSIQGYYKDSAAAREQLMNSVGSGGTINRTTDEQKLFNALNNSGSFVATTGSFLDRPNDYASGAYTKGLTDAQSQIGLGMVSDQLGTTNVGQAARVATQVSTAGQVANLNAAMTTGAVNDGGVSQSLIDGKTNQAAKDFGQTMGYGSTLSPMEAFRAGLLGGGSAAKTDSVLAAVESNNTKKDNYLQGVKNAASRDAGDKIADGRTMDDITAGNVAQTLREDKNLRELGAHQKRTGGNISGTSLDGLSTKAAFESGAAGVEAERRTQERFDQKGYSKVEAGARMAQMQADQQMGSVDAYGKNQAKFGDSFAIKTSYSSGLNQAAQAMAQINQAGSPESLAQLLAVSAAASVSGIQGSIRGAHGAGNYISLAGKQAEVQTGIGSQMMSTFGVGGLTTAGYASQAASTQGTLDTIKNVFEGKTEGFIQQASTVAQANATKTAAEIKEAKGSSGFIGASKLMGVQSGATMAFLNERAASKDLAAKENAAYEKSGMTGDTLLSSGLAKLETGKDGITRMVATTGAERVAAEAKMQAADRFGMKGGMASDGRTYGIQSTINANGEAVVRVSKVAQGTGLETNVASEASNGNMDQKTLADKANLYSSKEGAVAWATDNMGAIGAATAGTAFGAVALNQITGGRLMGAARGIGRNLRGLPSLNNRVDKETPDKPDNNQHHGTGGQTFEHQNHKTPPSGYSERPSGLLVPDSISHSPTTVNHIPSSGVFSKLTSYAGRHLPGGAGVAIGTAMAAEQAMSGDKIGAAMTMASTATATIPGIGTAASFAIDAVQMGMQASGISDKLNNTLSQDAHKTTQHIENTANTTKQLELDMQQVKSDQLMNQWDTKDTLEKQQFTMDELREMLREGKKRGSK